MELDAWMSPSMERTWQGGDWEEAGTPAPMSDAL